MANHTIDPDFPCSITTHIPLPTPRLALATLRSLSVDAELSPLVQRSFSVVPASFPQASEEKTVFKVEYKATTNRMLRVAVNSFFESLGVVVQVMAELDVDVLAEKGLESLEGAQGVEVGNTGTTAMGA